MWDSRRIPLSKHWPTAVWPPGWLLWLLLLARARPCFGAALLLPHSWHTSCSLLIAVALSYLQMRTLNSWDSAQLAALSPSSVLWCTPAGVIGWPRCPAGSRYSPAFFPSAPHLPTPSQAAGWGPWLLTLVSAQRAERVLSKDGAGCPPSSPEVLAGRTLRRKDGQETEENELPCNPIGGPRDSSAAGSMTSEPQALVTAETKAPCQCLSSGSK